MSELPGSSKPSSYALYKPGQGKWSRGIGAASLVAIGIWAAIETYTWIPMPPPGPGPNDIVVSLSKENGAKILDWLDSDGFFARAVPEAPTKTDNSAGCVIAVQGGGIYLRETVVCGDALTKKVEKIGDLAGTEARSGMDKLLAALKEATKGQPEDVQPLAPAPRDAKKVAEDKTKLKGALADFSVSVRYAGRPQKGTLYAALLATQPPMGETARKIVASLSYVVPGLLLLFFLVCAWFIANRRGATDFIIETETEMKKVTWPTMREVMNATVVVIIVTIVLGVFMFFVDRVVIQPAFEWVGILPKPHA